MSTYSYTNVFCPLIVTTAGHENFLKYLLKDRPRFSNRQTHRCFIFSSRQTYHPQTRQLPSFPSRSINHLGGIFGGKKPYQLLSCSSISMSYMEKVNPYLSIKPAWQLVGLAAGFLFKFQPSWNFCGGGLIAPGLTGTC